MDLSHFTCNIVPFQFHMLRIIQVHLFGPSVSTHGCLICHPASGKCLFPYSCKFKLPVLSGLPGGDTALQFTFLPFGLTAVPWVFTDMMNPATQALLHLDVEVLTYLPDCVHEVSDRQ